jgi:prolyl oligopeptidase
MRRPPMQVATLFCAIAASVALAAAAAAVDAEDPFLWLEDVHGARALDWVNAENAKTSAALDSDAVYQALFADAKLIAEAKDRIPHPRMIRGRIYNFWQDAGHEHGIWRQTSLADYRTAAPHWRTVLDLDALSKQEQANWFWKGAGCAEPLQQHCLLALSDGGEDAQSLREFDLAAGKFVAAGFAFPRGKQLYDWEGSDTLLMAREWKSGELTPSGYPFVVKRIKRGQPLEAAVEIFRGSPDDVFVIPAVLNDGAGNRAVVIRRSVSFFEAEHYLVLPTGTVKLSLPKKIDIVGLLQGRLILSLSEDWKLQSGTLPQGALISIDLAAASADPGHLHPTLVYQPGAREAFVEASVTREHLLLHTLDEVNGRAQVYTPAAGDKWSTARLDIPNNVSVDLEDADLHSNLTFLRITGFLTPTRLILADLGKGSFDEVKHLPAKFDASRDVVEQFQATSNDGTRIPYFIVHRSSLKMDGSTPTILNAYGGFQSAETPSYSADLGKLWLERGGAFVLANIRGGGEFGPAWHEAGLKMRRQRIYDDFTAVALDLIAKGFTSPARLGIRGGSNGGLLMGVEFTQHPELWGAVDIEIPLLDMLRFEQIAAGSLWVGEYGSVANPDEKAFLASISPYNNLRPNVRYPEPLIWSTTKDDRVGPQHARKFAAKLAAMGYPYYYYEVTEGGHGSSATPVEHAQMAAREYAYFSRKLAF